MNLRSVENAVTKKSAITSLAVGGSALVSVGLGILVQRGEQLSELGEKTTGGVLAVGLLSILASLGAAARAEFLTRREIRARREMIEAQVEEAITQRFAERPLPDSWSTITPARRRFPSHSFNSPDWTGDPEPLRSLPFTPAQPPGQVRGTGCLVLQFKEFPAGFKPGDYGCAALGQPPDKRPEYCTHSGKVEHDPDLGNFLLEKQPTTCFVDLRVPISETTD